MEIVTELLSAYSIGLCRCPGRSLSHRPPFVPIERRPVSVHLVVFELAATNHAIVVLAPGLLGSFGYARGR